MHAVPIVPSPTVQTIARKLLPNAAFPATTIAATGSQNRTRACHGLERMSRDLQVVVPDSMQPRFHCNDLRYVGGNRTSVLKLYLSGNLVRTKPLCGGGFAWK